MTHEAIVKYSRIPRHELCHRKVLFIYSQDYKLDVEEENSSPLMAATHKWELCATGIGWDDEDRVE